MRATVFVVMVCVLAGGCKDQGTTVEGSSLVRVEILTALLWADFRTPSLPDEDGVRCEFSVRVYNTSHSVALEEGRIPWVEVFRTGTMERLGAVQLETTWNGHLAPGAIDTVLMRKLPRQGPTLSVPLPCGEFVSLTLRVTEHSQEVSMVRADSLLFECLQ